MKKIIPFILVALMAGSCKFIEEKGWFGKGADTLAVYQMRMDSIRVADSIRKEVEAMKAIEQARLDSIRVIEQAALERMARFRYHVIVGSFKNREYADRYSEFIAGKGYRTEILFNEYQFNVVSAKAYDNLREAIRELENFRNTVEPGSWIYIKK